MNTEAPQDQTAPLTTGERLRQGREKLELTQQAVAERLCLKVSTVRDIEEDKAPADLASTFCVDIFVPMQNWSTSRKTN